MEYETNLNICRQGKSEQKVAELNYTHNDKFSIMEMELKDRKEV